MELRKAHRSPHSRARRLAAAAAICAAALLLAPPSAFAQLDPLLFLQRSQPNVIIAVDVANRMQFDADGTYYDPYDYTETGAAWEALLGVVAGRDDVPPRVYKSLVKLPPFSVGHVHRRDDRHPRQHRVPCSARSGRGRAWPWRARA